MAVTRHGVTVGWFIPTPVDREQQTASLLSAAAALDGLLAQQQVDVDEVVAEYRTTRGPQ